MERRRNWTAIGVCLGLGGLGLTAAMIGTTYRIGELTRMGPGFFPILVSCAVMILAIAAAAESARETEDYFPLRFGPVIFVSLGMLAWMLLIDRFGIVVATFALVGISSFAKLPVRPVAVLLLAAGLSISGYLVFIWGLGMPLTLWGR